MNNLKYQNLKAFIIFSLVLIGMVDAEPYDYYRRQECLQGVYGITKGSQDDDLSIVQRLVNSYRISAKESNDLGDSMWQIFFNQRHFSIHNTFMNGSTESSAKILRDPSSSELFYGFDLLVASSNSRFDDILSKHTHANLFLDRLIRFGEAIGAIPLDYPEGYHIPPTIFQADDVLKKITKKLGITLTFPNPYPNENGFVTSQGIISYRVTQALYQAYRIKQLVKSIPNPKILEIGAGLGRTAFYARAFGIKDYTIVDIPFTAMSSGYFLARTLGENSVLFAHEESDEKQDLIKFLTPHDFFASHETYDLIINVDGLTEMDINMAHAYWNKIEQITPLFISINHEVNPFTVNQLIEDSPFVDHYERHNYWMRRGYVEEVVYFTQTR